MFDEGLDTVPGKVAQQLRCVRQLHVAELLSNCLAKSTGLGLRTDNQLVYGMSQFRCGVGCG